METRFHIAVHVNGMTLHVGMRPLRARAAEEHVGRGVGMEDRHARRERGVGVEDRGKLLVFHLNEPRGLLRDPGGVGGDRGNPIADEQHAVPTEDRPVLQSPPQPTGLRVGAGQHGANARELPRGRDVDRAYARVRVRTRHVRRVQHAGHRDVGRVARRAGHFGAALDPVLGLVEDRSGALDDAGHRAVVTCRARQSAKSPMS